MYPKLPRIQPTFAEFLEFLEHSTCSKSFQENQKYLHLGKYMRIFQYENKINEKFRVF